MLKSRFNGYVTENYSVLEANLKRIFTMLCDAPVIRDDGRFLSAGWLTAVGGVVVCVCVSLKSSVEIYSAAESCSAKTPQIDAAQTYANQDKMDSSYFLGNVAVFITNDYKQDLKLSFCHTCQ